MLPHLHISLAGLVANQAEAIIVSLLNARPVDCRPVTLLAYSLSFCTNYICHNNICIHVRSPHPPTLHTRCVLLKGSHWKVPGATIEDLCITGACRGIPYPLLFVCGFAADLPWTSCCKGHTAKGDFWCSLIHYPEKSWLRRAVEPAEKVLASFISQLSTDELVRWPF